MPSVAPSARQVPDHLGPILSVHCSLLLAIAGPHSALFLCFLPLFSIFVSVRLCAHPLSSVSQRQHGLMEPVQLPVCTPALRRSFENLAQPSRCPAISAISCFPAPLFSAPLFQAALPKYSIGPLVLHSPEPASVCECQRQVSQTSVTCKGLLMSQAPKALMC